MDKKKQAFSLLLCTLLILFCGCSKKFPTLNTVSKKGAEWALAEFQGYQLEQFLNAWGEPDDHWETDAGEDELREYGHLWLTDSEQSSAIIIYTDHENVFQTIAISKDVTPRTTTVETAQITQSEAPSETNSAVQTDGIPFRYLHRGFTAIQLTDRESFEQFSSIGLKVILTEEDWSDYMGRFCPGIPYFDSFDFSKECLLASVNFGARPAYVQSHTIKKLSVEDGCFAFEFADDPAECLALNTNDTTHFYVEVLIINRADLPADIEEMVYHAAPAPTSIDDILAGSAAFYSLFDQKYMTLKEFCQEVPGFDCPVAFTKFAFADVNADGTDEVVLWLSTEGEDTNPVGEPNKAGVLILRQEASEMVGQFLPYHDLYDLKADGSFCWYGKHGSSGAAYLDTSDRIWCRRVIATEEKKDYSSPDNTMVRHVDRAAYSLDDTLSDEEAYRQAMEIQTAKEDVFWVDFEMK